MGKELVPELRFEGFEEPWEEKKLGDVVQICDSARIPNNLWTQSGIPYIRASDISAGNLEASLYISEETYRFYSSKTGAPMAGDLLFNGGGEIGASMVNDGLRAIYPQGGAVLYAKTSTSNDLSGDFLKHLFATSSVSRQIDVLSAGGTMKHFTLNPAKELTIAKPHHSEQSDISTSLNNLGLIITLHQRKYEALRAVKSSMLDKMFPKEGETEPELRFDGFTGPWERVKLSDVYRKGDEKNSELEFGFDRTISVSNMKWNPAGNGAASSSLPTYKILRKGDIAFEGNRTKGHPYGKMVINDIGDGIMSSRFRTIAARGPVCIRFWKYYLLNDAVFRPIYIRSTKRGTLMTELVTEELLESELLIPSSEEQELIGGALNAADKQIVCEATNLATLKQLKAALLDKMFPKGAR